MSFHLDPAGMLKWEPWEAYDWLRHGFWTRRAGNLRGLGARETVRVFGGGLQLACVRQVHSNHVVLADEIEAGRLPEADAIITDRPGRLLAAYVADCTPLLLIDPSRRAVAAIHAGWRGTAVGVAARTVERLEREFGSSPRDLEALIGPCIGVAKFEVGEEVARRFDPQAVVRKPTWPRPHVDLPLANRLQLQETGLSPGRIFDSGLCTFEREDWFFSYRRDGPGVGRMAGFIGLPFS